MGRTLFKFSRFYADGIDLSGFTRAFGPLAWEFEEVDATCPLGDTIKGYLPNLAMASPGVLNTVLSETDPGIYDFRVSGVPRTVTIPIGVRAAPVAGDDVFMGEFAQNGYRGGEDGGLMILTIPFGPHDATTRMIYDNPWGVLIHAAAERDAVNAAAGIDDNGAASAYGGYMVYQVFAGDGDAEILIQDAAVNADVNFADLADATTGVIDCTVPSAGVVQLARNAAVRQYLRWQVDFAGGATEVTFALAFHRNLRV